MIAATRRRDQQPPSPGTAAGPSPGSSLVGFDDRRLARLAGRGTPSFCYDLDAARRRFRTLRAALPPRVQTAYAVKSNPGAPLLRALADEGASFDCASAGELHLAHRALLSGDAHRADHGADGGADHGDRGADHGSGSIATDRSRIYLAGPGKRDQDLRAGLEVGARVQVDGLEDLRWLQAHWQGPGPLPVSLRVHPAAGIAENNPIIGGAGPSAFGVDEEDVPALLAQARELDRVQITGVQVFAASNELQAGTLVANHRVAFEIARTVQQMVDVEIDLIDLGGGLGVPYAVEEPELDLEALGSGLASVLADHSWFSGQVVLEPGRWLSAPIGVYLTTVTRIKRSRGVSFAILAGGINHLLRPLLTGQSFPVHRVAQPGHAEPAADAAVDTETFTLAGPLCTSLDRVGVAELPTDLGPGDLLAFGQAGAYASTQAMTHFLQHPPPAEHWLDG